MPALTDAEAQYVKDIWENLNKKQITAQALERVFTVYPWTTRLFTKLNKRFAANDPNVQIHADKVQAALDKAFKNINKIEETLATLSKKHQKIGVDTQNFELLSHTFIVELAIQFKGAFKPELQKAVYKFLKLVSAGLSAQYQ